VPRTYSAAEVAVESARDEERMRWFADIGLLRPDEQGPFRFGDLLACKMASALLDSSLSTETIEY
jgi:hypothetical protein